ncbi:MAG: hypothetical protein RL462_1142 [Pseudomonadota bacterium]|jgi:conjugal transfer/type IV secretion protein DotA/TraY
MIRRGSIKLLPVFAGLLPSLALAQTGLMPPPSDRSVTDFLGTMFGELVRMAGGTATGGDAFGPIVAQFNEAVLLLGAILLAYTLVAGTMQTAHDGEVLGKKWSSMWLPIRTVLGIAAIVPIKGYCMAQIAVMWLTLQGIGIADNVWSAYAQAATVNEAVTVQQTSKQAAQVARTRLEQRMCMMTLNSENQRAQNEAAARGEINYIVEANGTVAEKAIGDAGVTTSGAGYSDGVCGSYKFPASTLVGNFGGTYDKAVFGDNSAAKAASEAMRTAHATALNALTGELDAIARELYLSTFAPSGMDFGKAYATAVANYDKALAQAAQNVAGMASARNEVAQNAAKDGWMMAGAWHMKFAMLQEQAYNAVNQFPEVTAPNLADVSSTEKDAVKAYQDRLRLALGGLTDEKFGVQTQYASDKASREGGFSMSALMHRLFSTGDISTWLTNGTSDTSRNPVLWAQDLGHTMLNTVWGGFLGALAVVTPLGTKVLGNGLDLGPSVMLALPLIAPLAFMGLGFGAMAAYYLPLAPFILFFGAFIGWLILVVEAIIAAPLWAAMHLAPDGDGVAGQGGQGYMLVMSLVLRPVLMILGLVASMVLIYPIGTLFNQVFAAVFGMTNGNNLVGVFGLFALFSIYTMTMVALIHKTFSLIHFLPDTILRWAGGGSDTVLGSNASELEHGARGGTTVIASVAQRVGHMTPRGKVDDSDNDGTPTTKPMRPVAMPAHDVPVARQVKPVDVPQGLETKNEGGTP